MIRLQREQLFEIRWPAQHRVCSVFDAFFGGEYAIQSVVAEVSFL